MNKILTDQTAEALRVVVREFFKDIPNNRLVSARPRVEQMNELYDTLYRDAEDFFVEKVVPF
jgi:hypothetical protein